MGLITYKEAYQKLEKWNQIHILKYYEELSPSQKEELLAQIAGTDFSVLKESLEHSEIQKGVITPLEAMQIDEIETHKEEFYSTGLEALKEGKIGAVLLAGGMGTRLGSDDPKGMYNIGVTKDVYIFQRLIENLMEVVEAVGHPIHLFVMTSDKNHKATTEFFQQKAYFGYNKEYIHFFMQEMAPATDYQGKVYLEEKWKMSASPNGNGGWFISLVRNGLDTLLHETGIEWLNVFSVDNVLQRIADPYFVGATIQSGAAVGSKVVRKSNPDEKVGVMCLEDGKPSIVEYYELTQEMMEAKDKNGDPAYNFGVILNYLFRVKDLEILMENSLPVHIVEKKIPCLDEQGNLYKPEEPNGYKYENLVLDMIHQMDSCLPYEVIREKEFAPIKNKTGVDSVDSARELLRKNGITI